MKMILDEMNKPEYLISADCIIDLARAMNDVVGSKYHPLAYIGRRRVTSEYKKSDDITQLFSTLQNIIIDLKMDFEFEEVKVGNIYNYANVLRGERNSQQ